MGNRAPPRREGSDSDADADADADLPETSRSDHDGARRPPPLRRPLRQQLLGACRADDRLRPLLTLNVSCAAADDRFISHLSQHFEVSEVGLLARCLCVPLVSLRVGTLHRHGPLLCPTPIRGNLSLVLLPSSSMRITFAGDDGHSEQLALLNNGFDISEVKIEEIPTDDSGRSFLIRISDSQVFYYWCAEKLKEHGMELVAKMKNLLQGRPTLSELTGISNSRLDAFATHLHAYLFTSSIGDVKSLGSLHDFFSTSSPHDQCLQSPSAVSKSFRSRASAAIATKAASVYQASLSPRPSTFKDGLPRTSCAKIVGREKLKRRGEWLCPSTTTVDGNHFISSSLSPDSTGKKCDGDRLKNSLASAPVTLPLSFPLLPSFYPLATQCPPPGDSLEKPFKPYYCWCPPCPSSLQYSINPLHMPVTSLETLPVPPLSSLLSNELPAASAVSAKLDTTDLPSLNLPSILHDPLLHLPLPASPLVPLHGSQVPTFTPLMSDPIVHVPLIDVCSSGQAYLVSCGASLSSTVPLLPSLKPLIPETESLVERSARETLMRLIASTPPLSNPQLANILPAVLADVPENISRATNVNKHVGIHLNDDFFSSSCVKVIGSGIAAMELRVEDEVSSGDGANATLAKYDYISDESD